MKRLTGTAAQAVDAPLEHCYELLADVEGYPSWHPDVVRSVDVLTRDTDGQATVARATLHVSAGPLVRDFNLVLAVQLEPPRAVTLTRQPDDPGDEEEFRVSWRLSPAGAGTRIALDLDANLSVPRLLPLGGIGESLAEGFVVAAASAVRHNR